MFEVLCSLANHNGSWFASVKKVNYDHFSKRGVDFWLYHISLIFLSLAYFMCIFESAICQNSRGEANKQKWAAIDD